MKTVSFKGATRIFRLGFTLTELMIATAIGVGLSGTVVLLLVQSATEQRNGFADITVEEQAYMLEANITRCLRSMSANQGLTPNFSSGFSDPLGNLLGYQSVVAFYPTNGAYVTATITYSPSTGQVIYTPDVTHPSVQMQWMTNSASAALTEIYFSTSFNPDGSQNNSLVNVAFQMSDNGFTRRNPTNNPAGIFRTFSVQMRNDN